MGLDITAYQHVTRIDDVQERYGDDCVNLYIDHPERAPSLTTGLYRWSGDKYKFRAGSYGGYSHWRNWLCQTILQVEPGVVWNHRELYKGRPFVELINFSDCEGVIGPEVCAKLAKNFSVYRDDAVSAARHSDEDAADYYITNYDHWRHAFTLAAVDGAVNFH